MLYASVSSNQKVVISVTQQSSGKAYTIFFVSFYFSSKKRIFAATDSMSSLVCKPCHYETEYFLRASQCISAYMSVRWLVIELVILDGSEISPDNESLVFLQYQSRAHSKIVGLHMVSAH